MESVRIQKIISGGQTGADRAALDFAIAAGISHGGWCPLGRLAEDGPIPSRYALQETPTADYAERTAWNVRDSDATLIVSIGPSLRGGTELTRCLAGQLGKPILIVCKDRAISIESEVFRVRAFTQDFKIAVMNVAGPRASEEPGIYGFTTQILQCAFDASPLNQIEECLTRATCRSSLIIGLT